MRQKDFGRAEAYIAVAAKVLQELDLPQRSFCQDLLAEDIGNLLDGNALSRGVIGGCAVKLSARGNKTVNDPG